MLKIINSPTIALGLVIFLTLSGCAYNVNPYSPSAENVKDLGKLNLEKFQFNGVASKDSNMSSITCRGAGPIEAPNGETYETYIIKALKSELELADLISNDSPLKLQAKLEHIDFDSGMSGGKWEITLMLTNGMEKLSVASEYPFESYFVADKACQSVAQAFRPAVQKAISETIANPQFKNLISGNKAASIEQ